MKAARLIPNNPIFLTSLTFLLSTFSLSEGTLSKSNPKKVKQNSPSSSSSNPTASPDPSTQSVFDRGLVKEKFKVNDLLTHHSVVCKSCVKTRRFDSGAALAYVTPWNNRGYDIAKELTKKFTHVSPVWLQLKFVKNLHLEVTGTHDVDADWIKTLRRRNKNIKIVPRLLLDGWSGRDYARVFASEDAMASVAKTVAEFLWRDSNDGLFDGVVFETTWLSSSHRQDLLHLLVHVGEEVRRIGKEFILVVPPASPDGVASDFGAEEFRELRDAVDFFSLMTYDYPMRPGPNSPIEWVKKCVRAIVGEGEEGEDEEEEKRARRSQLLVGLNFYGYKYGQYGSSAILGSELVGRLNGEDKFKVGWNRDAMEHKFSARGEEIYFPTLYSIQKRLELFQELGTGLSIWEIGQGLDYFYELL